MKFDLKRPDDSPRKWGKEKKVEKEKTVDKNKTTEKESQSPRMERDITIKVNPKKLFKGFFLVTLILGVFFLGRLSVPGNFALSSDLSELVDLSSSSPSAAATADEPVKEEVVEEKPAEEPEEPKEEPKEEPEEEPVKEEPKEEEIITEYDSNKVSLAITEVGHDWKDTWGKINTITFSFKNDLGGTIKPNYFTLMVEGYPADEPGEFDAPYTFAKVKSMTSVQDTVVVYNFGGKTKGFSYSPTQTGNIKEVDLRLFLWDESKNLIAHAKKTVDLS